MALPLPSVALSPDSRPSPTVPGTVGPERPMVPSSRPARARRGIAILSVITVLVALILIAIPFVISMKLGRDRTTATAARNRAAFEADLVCRAVTSFLHGSHPAVEQARRAGGGAGLDADDATDAMWEYTPPPTYRKTIADLMGSSNALSDPRASIWSWRVTNANALANPNGAKPQLLGNLVGAATLTEDLDASATTIPVEDVMPVPSMGLPGFREDGGFVRIGNEVIQYQTFRDGAFQGCSRGVLRETPLRDNGPGQEHKKGDRVVDHVAYKLATHLISARPGTLTSFDTLEGLRSIQGWGGGGVLDPERFEALLPHLTVWSRRETAESFLDGQRVLNALPEGGPDAPGETLRFRDRSFAGGTAAYFNAGTLVRITDGRQTDYGSILHSGDEKGGQVNVVAMTASRLPDGRTYEGGRAVVQALSPYPIDINSASRTVLAAVFAGLRVRTVTEGKETVTAEKAIELADRIVKGREGPLTLSGDDAARKSGPFRDVKDFGVFLSDLEKEGVIVGRQREALMRNAANPNDADLAFGTAPFCYRSLDVYHVEGRAVVNDAAGSKEAEAALRQVVEIGADRAATWRLDSQADFEVGLALGSGGKYVETYPFNVGAVEGGAWTQPRKRAPQWMRGVYPSTEDGDDIGDVRLQASRVKLPGAVHEDHFDTSYYADGWYTPANGPYIQPARKLLRVEDPEDTWVHPFTVAFWMRPYSRGNWFAFDTGKADNQNRISLYVRDGTDGKELVLRVCDATMEGRGAEVYVPLQRIGYQPETWYHLQANVFGCDPGKMELLVDGVSVGRRRGMTFLTAGLSQDATQVSVDSTEGFEQEGALLVGDEVVEYDTRQADGFTDIVRGARGTTARDWPAGTGVKRVGYSHPLLLDVTRGGAALENLEWDKWAYMQLQYDQDQATVTINNVSLQFSGAAEGSTSFTATLVNADPADTTAPDKKANAFQSKGYALLSVRELDTGTGNGTGGGAGAGATLAFAPQDAPQPGGGVNPGSRTPSNPAAPSSGTASGPQIGGWEVVWYERSGTSLTVTRYQSTPTRPDPGTQYFMATKVMTPNGEQVWPCYVIPVSVMGVVAGTGTGFEYLDPVGKPEDKVVLERFTNDSDPDDSGPDLGTRPRCLVGSDSAEGAVEVFSYDAVDLKRATPNILFIRDNTTDLGNLANRLMGPASTPQDLGVPAATGTTTTPGGATLASAGPAAARGAVAAAVVRVDGGPVVGPVPVRADEPVPAPAPPPPAPPPTPTPGEPVPVSPPSSGDSGSGDGGSATPAPPTQGGTGPGSGREPPPDDSGGGGTEPVPGEGPGNNQPPAGVRPPSDPTTGQNDPGANPGTGTSNYPTMNDLKGVFPFRGVCDTGDGHHAAAPSDERDRLIVPCFRILRRHEDTGLTIGGPHVGSLDVVTLSTGKESPRREQKRVRWSHGRPGGRASSWVALYDFIEGERYTVDLDAETGYRTDYRGITRILKFPSGEMPDENGDNVVWGRNEVGSGSVVTAFLDELYFWRYQKSVPTGIVANGENLTEKDKEITLRALPPATTLVGVEGYDADCGLVQVDDELIVYRGTRVDTADTVTLEDCRRGALGTKARAHATGAGARFVPEVYVSYLSGDLGLDASTVALGRRKGWPREGAVRIVGDDTLEIAHYTGLSEQGLLIPEALDADPTYRGRGLLRGRFGTESRAHENGEIVVFHPFRYWDRTMLRRGSDRTTFVGVHDHPDASYLGLAKTVRDALWKGVSWAENLNGRTEGDPNDPRSRGTGRANDVPTMDVVVLARFDQGVPWDSAKVVDLRDGGRSLPPEVREQPQKWLYVLDKPGTDMPDGMNALGLEATTAEFRVFFVYLKDAYRNQEAASSDPADLVFENAWKNTPWLRSFSVKYQNRTRVRTIAEIR